MKEELVFNCSAINNLDCGNCPLNHVKNSMMQSNHCNYINYVLELLNVVHLNKYVYSNWDISDFQHAVGQYGRREDF